MTRTRTTSLTWIKWTVLLIFILGFIISTIKFIFDPSVRTGPVGIGLPAQMTVYEGKQIPFEFQYPKSWVVGETPEGNHGDDEIIAEILVPGKSWPKVVIEKITISSGDVSDLANYQEKMINLDKEIFNIALEPFKTPNLRGLVREYSWRANSLLSSFVINCRDYYFVQGNFGYTVSFCAKQENWLVLESTFNKMIDSFLIKGS